MFTAINSLIAKREIEKVKHGEYKIITEREVNFDEIV
mgnify:CR=1 FL=1